MFALYSSVPSDLVEANGVDVLGAVLEGRYRVDAPLARGGMSSVYSGVDLRLDRPVAIKVMESKFAGDRSFIDRFELEARAAARLHHPSVVAVHDQGVDGEHVYLVMELVSGGTLRDLVREQGPLPVPLAISVLEPVLTALASAHRAGLVHRDVKPENVLIGQGGAVKVADFGLVRAIATAGITSDSMILGTVAYLSPEQVTTGVADARSDVYSAGIVCYEMLTGVPPYIGDTPISVAYRHVNDDVPPPSESVPGIPAALDDLVLRATRRDPALRPVDAAAFLEELVRTRNSLGIRKVPVPTPTPPATSMEAPSETPSPGGAHASGLTARPLAAAGRHRAPGEGGEPVELGGPAGGVPNGGAEIPTGGKRAATEIVSTDMLATHRVPFAPTGDDPNAVTLRTAPVRPSPIGPQGTRAMSRADLNAMPAGPHTGGVPVGTVDPRGYGGPPPPPGHGPQRQRDAMGNPYQVQRKRSRRTVVIWIAVVLAIAAVVGVVSWWFGSGRWTAVPKIGGLDPAAAERTLQASDLTAALSQAHDNSVPAGRVVSTIPTIGSRTLRGSTIRVVISEGKPIVPDITAGAAPGAVEEVVRKAQLTPKLDPTQDAYDNTVPKGDVVSLNPPPGSQLNIGGQVVVVLSKGPAPKPVPDVTNQPHDQAFAALTQAGFQPFDEPATFNGQVGGGSVIKTDPPAGTVITGSSLKVGVVVSNAVAVPSLTGQGGQAAVQALQTLGLQAQVQAIANDPNGQVFAQNPGPNTLVAPGSTVTITVFP
jgi:beta-lactam-binding protein with PASTA domain